MHDPIRKRNENKLFWRIVLIVGCFVCIYFFRSHIISYKRCVCKDNHVPLFIRNGNGENGELSSLRLHCECHFRSLRTGDELICVFFFLCRISQMYWLNKCENAQRTTATVQFTFFARVNAISPDDNQTIFTSPRWVVCELDGISHHFRHLCTIPIHILIFDNKKIHFHPNGEERLDLSLECGCESEQWVCPCCGSHWTRTLIEYRFGFGAMAEGRLQSQPNSWSRKFIYQHRKRSWSLQFTLLDKISRWFIINDNIYHWIISSDNNSSSNR